MPHVGNSQGSLLLRGGRVIDPASGLDKTLNVFIAGGKIASLGTDGARADRVIDAKGLVVCPGLIDMHVHLREPGREEEETIASGAAAAVHGGFTSVAAMPNTDPPVDSEASAEFVTLQAGRTQLANVFPIGTITKGRKGEELSEMGQLVRGGAVAFSDDGEPVQNAQIMRLALQYSKMFDRAIISHAEDKTLSGDGVMHEGKMSTILGLAGIPRVAEEIMVHRDIVLAGLTGGRLHIAHASTAGTVALVRAAKARGIRVTCEVTPHHLTLTDEAVRTYDPRVKMNPPLRPAVDVTALREGLRDGTLDAIATDHAPHSTDEKEVEFNVAPFGVVGLETALGLILTQLVETRVLTLTQALAALTIHPARILGIPKGTLTVGADADVTVFDPAAEWTVDPEDFKSKSRNTPFAGWKLKGRVKHVVVGGRVVF